MQHSIRFAFAFTFALLLTVSLASTATAQSVNTTVQLPTFRVFNVNTVVSVPDGGTLTIAGGSTSSSSFSRRRRSRSLSRSVSPVGVSVSPTLIIRSEVEAELDRRGRLIRSLKTRPDIHGTQRERSKASFIARHLGRGLK